MRIPKRIYIPLSAVVLLIAVAFCFGQSILIHSSTSYACSRCRAVRHVSTWFGRESQWIEENDYSRSFSQSHLQHEHHWCWCGTYINHYVLGVGRACGRQHALWQVPIDIQRRFVQSASPAELDHFFVYMDTEEKSEQQKGVEMAWNKVMDETK